MKTIKELINEGLSEVAATRDIQRQENIKRVYKDFPELKEIDNQIMDVRNSRFIAVIDKDERLIKRFDIAEEELQVKRDKIIARNHIDPSFDAEKSICDKCNDTGYTKGSDGTVKVCSCRKRELEMCYEQSGMADYSSYKMKNYRDDYLGNAATRKKNKNELLKVMLGIDSGSSVSPLCVYSAPPQTGKTFLAVCICKSAIKLGKSAYYAKCEDLSAIGADTLEALKRIDFLVIDDFADEVTLFNNVGSVLNSILETRAAAKLPTVLVTPFPKSELISKCDMRISGKLSSAKLISSEGR
jgi:DNA replication protein DnaC